MKINQLVESVIPSVLSKILLALLAAMTAVTTTYAALQIFNDQTSRTTNTPQTQLSQPDLILETEEPVKPNPNDNNAPSSTRVRINPKKDMDDREGSDD